MTLKICHEWTKIEYIEATCPHCRMIDTYFGDYTKDDACAICRYCGKQFKLGEQE